MSRRVGRAGPVGSGGHGHSIRPHLPPRARQRLRKIFDRRIGLPQELLKGGLRRRRPLGDKDQFQVIDDPEGLRGGPSDLPS